MTQGTLQTAWHRAHLCVVSICYGPLSSCSALSIAPIFPHGKDVGLVFGISLRKMGRWTPVLPNGRGSLKALVLT